MLSRFADADLFSAPLALPYHIRSIFETNREWNHLK